MSNYSYTYNRGKSLSDKKIQQLGEAQAEMNIYEKANSGYYQSKLENNKLRKEHQSLLDDEFKKDALEYVGLTNHPKAEKAFYLAWERGHSEGYYSVVQDLEELAELLKD